MGGGGGGGGGDNAGRGGGAETGNGDSSGGGGGGGGRSSAASPHWNLQFFRSSRRCEYKHTGNTCHGQVTVSWTEPAMALINPHALPVTPLVRVLPVNLHSITLPLILSPISPSVPLSPPSGPAPPGPRVIPVRLRLLYRHKGHWRKIASRTVRATETGPTQIRLPFTKRVRRIMRDARLARFRLIASNAFTGQRISRQSLRLTAQG
jgi:hypothetical protein